VRGKTSVERSIEFIRKLIEFGHRAMCPAAADRRVCVGEELAHRKSIDSTYSETGEDSPH